MKKSSAAKKSGAPRVSRAKKNQSNVIPRHILIVEDEQPMAHALQLKLESEGYRVTIAANGREALSLLDQNIDCMLLDLIMPSMDGFGLLREIGTDPGFPILIISNLSQEEDRVRAASLGAKGFLIKSDIQLRDISGAIANLFARS